MTSRRLLWLCAALLVLVPALHAQKSAPATPENVIRQLLYEQVTAWNKGDLEGFMAGYWKSPDLVFFSGGTRTQGWDATLARYRKHYQEGGKEMGTLEFRSMDVQVLGRDAAFVRGEWHLTMKDGSQPHGLTTLILKRFPTGWRIVHDHSCSE